MRKIITASALFLCLSILNSQHAFAQDTQTKSDSKEEMTDDNGSGQDSTAKCCSLRPIRVGAELGLNVSDLLYSTSGGGISSTAIARARIGAIIDIPFSNSFSLQPGIFYAMNGAMVDNNTINLNTIEVPVNVMYRFHMACCGSLSVGAGPYIGYNVSGTESNGTLRIGSDASDDVRALDFGVGANVAYELCDGIFFRARYQYGVANLLPETSSAINRINAESYGIQVGYFFGTKCTKCARPEPMHDAPNAWDE
jgi:hypothetical protein